MATSKPSAGRVAAHRKRLREAGLRPLEVWARPEDHKSIKDFVAAILDDCKNPKDEYVHNLRGED